MKLSPNFTLAEFTSSRIAKARGIANEPNMEEIDNLTALCVNILEPVRKYFGKPVIITSGYRSPELNKAAGGAPGSQHMRGQAVDFTVRDVANHVVWLYIFEHLNYDQVIAEKLYADKPFEGWIHASYDKRPGKNRKQPLSYIGKSPYLPGIHFMDRKSV